ncbi:uncharacterized protein LOC108908220 isoform X2 [Anoplophora glabripennis]|uniref:uncharacterized protein LOC108908220 isoform X2 n=1 Tax=Anoplophora glabripennis TaxID=217634 RepID=UPI0008759ED0|nr:uncharacterized protein LOC108908220 isoform X2 [Anoplophora glabripennis]
MESEEVEQVVDEESHDSEINVIPVQLVESYDVTLTSPSNSSNISRGKYYKQTYRPAWEQMPDFKGWLRGVEGEPTRAYCTYCQKTLHAHRLSLLKHTCTIRHQKAAQLHSNRKNKVQNQNSHMDSQEMQVIINEGTIAQDDLDEDGETHTVEYVDAGDIEDGDVENDNEDEEDGEPVPMEFHRVQFQKQQQQQQQQNQILEKPPISTHVIDMTRGQPITGLQVSLYKLIDGRWTYINEGVTNSSGMFSQFLDRSDFTPGRYKLHYDVDRYFEARKQDTLYPFIEIVFDSSLYTETYHIPMLLSPYGYTTYRGS